ncbi:hypothetical protein ACI2TD_17895 [Ralstonia nicotianae]|uniref:hypothetical protein n=1 Tax=Ralstonia pseudosolanacearum TaxID=1310165 RepID=UPI001FF9D49C
MDNETLNLIQARMANSAIGPSTIRGMAPSGTIKYVRGFLAAYDLAQLMRWTQGTYIDQLDEVTDALLDHVQAEVEKRPALEWGGCRKCVNIFLRNAMYNRYLAEAYRLDRLEPWMEVPLDSHVAAGLQNERIQNTPRWHTVIGLTKDESEVWQGIASIVAGKKGIHRVHLDVHYWRRKKEDDEDGRK